MISLWEALKITGPLSDVSKMPGYAFSTNAHDCVRGRALAKVPGSVCSRCYAIRGNFNLPHNQEMSRARAAAMDHPLWVQAMAVVINNLESTGFFRWFASGDLRSLTDLEKIVDVCYLTPEIRHWLPTREHKILRAFKATHKHYPRNLTIRLSADFIDKPVPAALVRELGAHAAGDVVSDGSETCPAHLQGNQCLRCRRCWSRSVKRVSYKLS